MVAVSDPLNFDTFDAVSHRLNRDVEWVCATPDQINAALRKYYGTAEEAADELASHMAATSRSAISAAPASAAPRAIPRMRPSSRWSP